MDSMALYQYILDNGGKIAATGSKAESVLVMNGLAYLTPDGLTLHVFYGSYEKALAVMTKKARERA